MYFITEKNNLPSDGENTLGRFLANSTCMWLLFPSTRSQLVEILYLGGNVLKQIIMFKDYLLGGVAQGIIMLSIE